MAFNFIVQQNCFCAFYDAHVKTSHFLSWTESKLLMLTGMCVCDPIHSVSMQ